ncbi:uncharacterized protein LOC130807738 [Amaranthus tricolor]|uniref:uncharacterized protein LOC130807738 n=1 Tax=Amaranthus tricolor TaxID=29722 RepID=UPI00258BF6BD|nr:uncharacterized protein LOC130807738 [Amaranthus tricolor]
MVSDQQIAEALQSLIWQTNPNSFTSLNQVILQLQSNLGFDLSNKIDFIRAHISLLFNSQPPPPPSVPVPPPSIVSTVNASLIVNPQSHFQTCCSSTTEGFHHPPPPAVQSYFPNGPTEINFAQPGNGTIAADALSSPSAKESTQSRPKRRGGPGGLNKLCGVTPQLQTIVGQPALPRTEIVRQLWAYIRKNNLQDPSNKRKIICNDELRLVFEVDCTDMFQMNKLLAKHIIPLDPTKVPEPPSKKAKVEEYEVPSTEPASSPSIVISEALAKFFGTSEKEMLQSEVYKRIEEYIKTEGLEVVRAARGKFERKKPHVNIGTIGHVDHGTDGSYGTDVETPNIGQEATPTFGTRKRKWTSDCWDHYNTFDGDEFADKRPRAYLPKVGPKEEETFIAVPKVGPKEEEVREG